MSFNRVEHTREDHCLLFWLLHDVHWHKSAAQFVVKLDQLHESELFCMPAL
jgi:hypothetical protein